MSKPRDKTLYRQVADRVQELIEGGTLRRESRIPSVRKLSEQLAVSVSTVLEAYRLLEDRGLIEARPQSGYYVRFAPGQAPAEPAQTTSCCSPSPLKICELSQRICQSVTDRTRVPFGAASPSPEFLPTVQLNRALARAARQAPEVSSFYADLSGLEELRVQIARRALEAGCSLTPEQIVVTAGAQEAVMICLRAVTRPGDAVIVETPTYYGLLEALESLHLRALEISTHPRRGICLEELERAVARERVAACVLVPNFGNPLGHCMSDERKKKVVEILEAADVPLIEDDVYGELCFEPPRPRAIKAFDLSDNVLLCSSFSKTLAPGYRIGWAVPGRHLSAVRRLKLCSSVTTATPTQMAVATFLADGGFDRYLRRLRRRYRDLVQKMTCALSEQFPAGTRLTRPTGGHVLWVELPEAVDAMKLYEEALRAGVSIAPGPLFSATQRYRNFVRLNCAVVWSERVEEAIETLGRLAGRQLAAESFASRRIGA